MSQNFCPHCMEEVPAGVDLCPQCGREVHGRAQPHQLPIGTVLKTGKGHSFLFGETKGDGGFGLTYIAKEMTSGKVVAIKEYFPLRCQPQRAGDLSVRPTQAMEEIYRRGMGSFLSEASMLRAVADIPHIVHVLDYFEANGTAYMVMEYLHGVTLKSWMDQRPAVEPLAFLWKVLPLMKSLELLHQAGVIHRDIAPDNIMLMPDGSLVLLDFGCARSMEDNKSMTVVLKPGFAPLEQYQTRGQGPWTDIYALCATVYFCLTGAVPPAAPERLGAVCEEHPDPLLPPSALAPAVPPALGELLLWGMTLQPMSRPKSMGQLAEDLESLLRTLARQEEPPVPPSFWNGPWAKVLLGVGCGLILLLLLLLLGQLG